MATNKAKKEKPSGKILDRIKKLLRMASDVTSPNEAAIAARRAERMMAEYNLTNSDMLTAGMSLDDFKDQFAGKAGKRLPRWIDILAVAVAEYTDCGVRKLRVPATIKTSLKFYGEATDIEICVYLWTYLTRTIERLCDESGVKHIGPRTSFKMGASSEICRTLRRMKAEDRNNDAVTSDGKSLVLVNKKAAMLKEKFGVITYSRKSHGISDGGAHAAGREAGRGVSIRKAVNSGMNTRRIGHG